MRMRFLCFSVIQYLFSCLSKISELPDFLILNFKNDLKIKLSDKDISFLSCIHFASHIQEPCVLWMRIVAKAIKWVFMSLTKACPAKILANKCIRGCYPHKNIYEDFISDASTSNPSFWTMQSLDFHFCATSTWWTPVLNFVIFLIIWGELVLETNSNKQEYHDLDLSR